MHSVFVLFQVNLRGSVTQFVKQTGWDSPSFLPVPAQDMAGHSQPPHEGGLQALLTPQPVLVPMGRGVRRDPTEGRVGADPQPCISCDKSQAELKLEAEPSDSKAHASSGTPVFPRRDLLSWVSWDK